MNPRVPIVRPKYFMFEVIQGHGLSCQQNFRFAPRSPRKHADAADAADGIVIADDSESGRIVQIDQQSQSVLAVPVGECSGIQVRNLPEIGVQGFRRPC